ncbi:hypothetical protein Cenrod_2632 [Candidatus Symbiobacter mobilis CR]|uniref:Uncharacterized protein n=1 Tax=Candidatus Symbiobacter mobilis CR TaxID=946483 RepID=U5NB84_9BURK|nr:hypothetical protein Cenrod_2632 [Candidatus Symbiobacter mobilis CR]
MLLAVDYWLLAATKLGTLLLFLWYFYPAYKVGHRDFALL